MVAYFLLYLNCLFILNCNLFILFYIQLYSVPPGFIRFALIRSFSYSFGATAFDCQFFFFLHLNILQVCNFILGL